MADDRQDQDPTPDSTPKATPPDASETARDQDVITGTPDPAYGGGAAYDDADANSGYGDYDDYDDDYEVVPPPGTARKKKKLGAPDEPGEPRRRGKRWPVLFGTGCLLLCCLCCIVPFCVITVVAGGIATVASNTEATSTTAETLEIDPDNPVSLTIDNPVGAVSIERGDSDQVTITARKRAYGWNNERAQSELSNIDVAMSQADDEPNDIRIGVDTNRDRDSLWSRASNVELTIEVPENVHLAITNQVGAIEITGVTAESLDLSTEVGGIVFEGELGGSSDARFQARTNTGGTIFRLPRDVYVNIDAETDVGDVDIDNSFDRVSASDERRDVVNDRWVGTLGSGEGDAPTLTLRSDTGGIVVEVR